MAKSSYDDSLKHLLVHEGGYSNHPSDPGGPTNFGITIIDYRKYINPAGTADDVRRMDVNDAKRIYRSKYWDALSCDRLPAGLDYSLFDYGVNSGIARAGRVLRRLCGLPDSDYHVTGEVLAAVARRDPKALMEALNDERLAFLQRLRTWPVFGRGWGSRVTDVRRISLGMANGAITDAPTAPAPGKGHVPAPNAGGAVASGAGLSLAAFWGFIGSHPTVAAIIVVAIGAGVYALIQHLHSRAAAAQLAPTPGIAPVPIGV
jgi:lysozyme family protein